MSDFLSRASLAGEERYMAPTGGITRQPLHFLLITTSINSINLQLTRLHKMHMLKLSHALCREGIGEVHTVHFTLTND